MKFCNSHLPRNIFNLYMSRFFFCLVYVCFDKECRSMMRHFIRVFTDCQVKNDLRKYREMQFYLKIITGGPSNYSMDQFPHSLHQTRGKNPSVIEGLNQSIKTLFKCYTSGYSVCTSWRDSNFFQWDSYFLPDQSPGLEVIKLEFILRLKIKRNDWLFADMCPLLVRKQPIIALYFESELVLKFYNLDA